MIRKATLEDVPQLVSLAIQMWKSHTVEDLTKIFCEHIRKGKNFIFLAISEEHIVGFAQCGLRFDYVEGTDSSPVGYLEGIFVLEEYKKRGYAKELLGECQNWAKDQGCLEFASDCELIEEEIYMLQAILIGLIVFIGKADYFIGTAMFGRPLVLGALVGIVLGDIPTGVMIGFQLELIFMGMQAIGASIPPDMIVGSVLGTAFAITTGKGMETAITIAMPAAILSAFVVNLFYGVITPIMAKAADRFAEEGKYMKIEGVFLSNGFLFDLTFAVIAFGAFLFGGDSVTAVVNAIPGWLTTGIGIAAGILPALGFAQLINMIMNKKVAVFFLLGFLLSAYMGISTVGIVCFSVVIVGILLIVKDFVPNQPALQGGMDDDNEF